LATRGVAPPADAQKAHAKATRALVEHAADLELPSSWLAPGPLVPRWESDLATVLPVLRGMLVSYACARQQLQDCIDLAE
jgi:hypothetical protein